MNPWIVLTDPRAAMPPKPRRAAPAPKSRSEKLARTPHFSKMFNRSLKHALMRLLIVGAMDRKAFRELGEIERMSRGSEDRFAVLHAMDALLAEGLIACEVKLTAKGYEKIGLKAPR